MNLRLKRVDNVEGSLGQVVEIPTEGDDEASVRNWVMMYMLANHPVPIEMMWRLGKLYITEYFADGLLGMRANAYLKLVEYMFGRLLTPYVPRSGLWRLELCDAAPDA